MNMNWTFVDSKQLPTAFFFQASDFDLMNMNWTYVDSKQLPTAFFLQWSDFEGTSIPDEVGEDSYSAVMGGKQAIACAGAPWLEGGFGDYISPIMFPPHHGENNGCGSNNEFISGPFTWDVELTLAVPAVFSSAEEHFDAFTTPEVYEAESIAILARSGEQFAWTGGSIDFQGNYEGFATPDRFETESMIATDFCNNVDEFTLAQHYNEVATPDWLKTDPNELRSIGEDIEHNDNLFTITASLPGSRFALTCM